MAGFVDDVAHQLPTLAQTGLQFILVGLQVDLATGYAAFHRRFSHRRGHPQQHTRIERLGNDVLRPKFEGGQVVGFENRVGNILVGQGGQRFGGGQFHLIIDLAGLDIERPPEDEGEAEDVVDLVGVIAASGGHNRIGPGFFGRLIRDLRVRVGHRKNNRLVGHLANHILADRVGHGQPDQDIGPGHRFDQGSILGLFGETGLIFIHPLLPPGVDDPFGVDQGDVFALRPGQNEQLGAGDGRGPGSVDHNFHLGNIFFDQFQGINQAGCGDDGRAVLVIVKDGNIEHLLEPLLDDETFRRFDVLQVNAAKGGGDGPDNIDDLLRVGGVHLDVEHVDVGEAFEQDAFSFHHRLRGQRSSVAQPQNRRAVGDDRHQITLGRITIGRVGIFGDFQHWHGHAGGVGQRQIQLAAGRFGGDDLDLARSPLFMIPQGIAFTNIHVKYSLHSQNCKNRSDANFSRSSEYSQPG